MTNMESTQHGFVWRKVKNGKVKVFHNYYAPREDVVNKPKEGERLLMYKYSFEDRYVGEYNCPPDPDGYLRRSTWYRID